MIPRSEGGGSLDLTDIFGHFVVVVLMVLSAREQGQSILTSCVFRESCASVSGIGCSGKWCRPPPGRARGKLGDGRVERR